MGNQNAADVCICVYFWGCVYCTILAAEVGHGHVLQRDLSEEGRALAARIPRHDSSAPKPSPKPRQAAVTVKRIGQEVPDGLKNEEQEIKKMTEKQQRPHTVCSVSVEASLTVWTGWAGCRRLRAGWCSAGCRRGRAA